MIIDETSACLALSLPTQVSFSLLTILLRLSQLSASQRQASMKVPFRPITLWLLSCHSSTRMTCTSPQFCSVRSRSHYRTVTSRLSACCLVCRRTATVSYRNCLIIQCRCPAQSSFWRRRTCYSRWPRWEAFSAAYLVDQCQLLWTPGQVIRWLSHIRLRNESVFFLHSLFDL